MIYHGPRGGIGGKYENNLDDLPGTVERAVSTLKAHADEFDCIVVQGMSGVVVGVPVSLALGKPLVIVRKKGEFTLTDGGGICHGQPIVNEKNLSGRWLFLDDFIGAGSTRKRCTKAVENVSGLVYVGEYLYKDDQYRSIGPIVEVQPRDRIGRFASCG